MKRIFYIVPILLLVGLSACKPAHDNAWDPDNPNKAMIRGTVYGMNDLPVPNAEIQLLQDTLVIYDTTSGADGYYEIGEIDPSLYRLVAYAPHYVPFEDCELESLPADTVAEHDIWFNTQHYCFEEEAVGEVQPFGFDTVSGTWAVIQDGSGSEYHTTPNVYHGENTAATPALAILKNSGPDFHLETKFKVSGSSATGWMTGAVFGFHGDTMNFYFVGITHTAFGIHKRRNHVDSLIQALPHTILPETWYDLTVQMCGQDIYVNLDGTEMNWTDPNPYTGKTGFWVVDPGGPGLVNFDDVLIGR